MTSTIKLFVDMDGTIAEWQYGTPSERLFEKDYFLHLPPYENMLTAVRYLHIKGVETYIVSAFFKESRHAYVEKQFWLDDHFPLDDKHRILLPTGNSKVPYVERRLERILTKTDVLLDDYTPNLLDWQNAGGTAIKVHNGGNCKSGEWTGRVVKCSDSANTLVQQLQTIFEEVAV